MSRKYFFPILPGLLFMFALSGACTKGDSEETLSKSEGGLTFCQIGPRMRVLDKKTFPEKPCEARAKIQGVYWRCGNAGEVDRKTFQFHQKLMDEAERLCSEFCKKQSSKCTSVFDRKEKCGLSVSENSAVREGREMGCRSACDGQAMMYCSIYNLGFRTRNPQMLAAQAENCRCYGR